MTELKQIIITENDSCPLSEEDMVIAKEMIKANPEWKCSIEGNSLQFGQYMIGSVEIGNTSIIIMPRNEAFTLHNYFEMMLYVNSDKFNTAETIGYSEVSGFGLDLITTVFITECEKLIEFGITGGYFTESQKGNIITGEINLEYYNRREIPYSGVCVRDDNYLIDVIPNQLLYAALKKLSLALRGSRLRKRVSILMMHFTNVADLNCGMDRCRAACNTFYSANPYYPLALELAFKIMTGMKVKFEGGNIQWNGFIFNSNDVFEKYVRKVLKNGLSTSVIKWSQPKEIASIRSNNNVGYKSYSPDVLIGYNEEKGSALAVLDAKNKKFNATGVDISDVLDNADLYQLVFYCDRLHTKLGGLVYPSMGAVDPIEVLVEGNNDYRFMLMSIDFSLPIRERNAVFIKNVESKFLIYS